MRLFLIRHAQTAWNIAGRAQGHTDIELDATGLNQARLLGQSFEGVGLSRIFCSDLKRTIQTARPIADATGAAIQRRVDLRERCFGVLEGANYAEVQGWYRKEAERLGIDDADVRPERGESVRDLWARLSAFADVLATIEGDTAAVMHGGSCGLLLSKLIHGTPHTARSFRLGNTAVTELVRRPDGFWRVERLNDISHLEAAVEAAQATA